MIRVLLPAQLATLAGIDDREIRLAVSAPVSLSALLDALEQHYPALTGTLREHGSRQRRPKVRFFAEGVDLSHESPDVELPTAVREGRAPFLIVAAIAGG